MQRRTQRRLLRPYPLGARFSGNNMSPQPSWLAGAQSACLNFSDNDLATTLHFALFNGSAGFVLKPQEMRVAGLTNALDRRSHTFDNTMSKPPRKNSDSARLLDGSVDASLLGQQLSAEDSSDLYWPPPRERLHRTTMTFLSLHNLPKRGEQRPCLTGRRSACHKYHAELSGAIIPPDRSKPSNPGLTVSLHPIGGFCAISGTLPLPRQHIETEVSMWPAKGNGMNLKLDSKVHCFAAEPHSTFIRIVVAIGGQEVAFETAVLGRLRHGYRVLRLRGMSGTRIEICHLFVRIRHGGEQQNLWATPRQLRVRALLMDHERSETESTIQQSQLDEIATLKQEIAQLKARQ
eukprot:7389537-Prymnesium_polylepis.1